MTWLLLTVLGVVWNLGVCLWPIDGDGANERCKWCGRFVSRDTEPTTRTVQGVVDDVLAWRTFTQVLCPLCSESWSVDTPWNRAADAA